MRAWQCFILVCAVAMAGVTIGCNEDDESPTGTSTLDVSGLWTGNATLESATGAGCAGATLSALVGLTYPLEIELDQSAMLVSGVQVSGLPIDGDDGSSCDLTGSVSDTGFELTSSNCDVAPIEDVSCITGERRDLVLVNATVSATVSGNDATGDTTTTWDTFEAGTGVSTGTLTVRADFSLSR